MAPTIYLLFAATFLVATYLGYVLRPIIEGWHDIINHPSDELPPEETWKKAVDMADLAEEKAMSELPAFTPYTTVNLRAQLLVQNALPSEVSDKALKILDRRLQVHVDVESTKIAAAHVAAHVDALAAKGIRPTEHPNAIHKGRMVSHHTTKV